MPAVPEFLLRKLYVQGSLKAQDMGFSFVLHNTFAPATINSFKLEVDGRPVPVENVSIQVPDGDAYITATITPESPFAFSVSLQYTIQVVDTPPGQGKLTLQVDTVEAGLLEFTIQAGRVGERRKSGPTWRLPKIFARPLKVEVQVDADELIGEIHPYIYGHFVEHLERCVYGGIWTADGARLREDTLKLVQALHPPLIRYPGGNFASGYHWEDGIGPKGSRPSRFDRAWNAWEGNQVGTDEFLAYCAWVGADPFLVVNDGSGTPEEAANWVAYCNQPADGEQGRRRAGNGRHEPYGVRLWGVGNEVWGQWQIGHTGADEYASRLGQFIEAMRFVDPSIRIVAVGDKVKSDAPDDSGGLWNETVLGQAGDLIDDLSFHLYQPDREGWLENYDLGALYYTVCAAPLDAETIIRRISAQITALVPERKIGVAFDEWNLWLPPPEEAETMHQVVYTLRDALYVAGMLNAFHRQCNLLSMANLAQLVNVLPAIVTDEEKAYATPIYYPFWMYRHMEPLALRTYTDVATFASDALGVIAAQQDVPYLDVTATRDKNCRRLALGVVNRHPDRKARVRVSLRGTSGLLPRHAWELSGPDPLASNSFDDPEVVRVKETELPVFSGNGFTQDFPAASVTVLLFER